MLLFRRCIFIFERCSFPLHAFPKFRISCGWLAHRASIDAPGSGPGEDDWVRTAFSDPNGAIGADLSEAAAFALGEMLRIARVSVSLEMLPQAGQEVLKRAAGGAPSGGAAGSHCF